MEAPLELIVAIYSDKNRANEVYDDIQRVARDGNFAIKDAAVLVKDADGDVRMHDREDVSAGRGALFGAVTGGLIGLLAGPAGAITGAVAGAATGGVTAALVDMGFSDEQLRELRDNMPPSSSALVTLIEHTWVDKLSRELEQRRGRLFRHQIPADRASRYER